MPVPCQGVLTTLHGRRDPVHPEQMALRATSGRTASLPGAELTFEVADDGDLAPEEIGWAGGGTPATGSGRRFATIFQAGGTFTVTAGRGTEAVQFPVAVCPVDHWLLDASEFFGPSIRLSDVRVRSSRFVIGPSGIGWTCNDVARFKQPTRPDDLPEEPTLIHELTHVWEHQSGQAQLLKGVVEQIGKLMGRDPYEFGGPDGVRAGRALTDFTKEGQAQIVMEFWRSEHGASSDTRGISFETPGYRDDLERLVRGAGIGTSASHRRSVMSGIDRVAAGILNGLLGVVE
jgi:hypothetical protein